MAAEDVLKADMDYAVDGFFGESIGWKSLSNTPESSIDWQSVNAVVDRHAETIGVTGDHGRSPIVVQLSKTDITSVVEGVDKVLIDAAEKYTVQEILSEDAGSFELYCI